MENLEKLEKIKHERYGQKKSSAKKEVSALELGKHTMRKHCKYRSDSDIKKCVLRNGVFQLLNGN